MSYPSDNDFPMYVLMNEGTSGNMVSYYEMAHNSDLITWESSFVSKTSVGETKGRLLVEEETRRRLGQLSL